MAKPFRFVHCADVHLDTPFRSRSSELRRRLTEAGRQAFESLVGLCLDESADALLIAGDLFDNDRLTLSTEGFLVDQLQRLAEAGIQVVAVTGNHDPGRADHRAHAIDWPHDGFHLLRSRKPETVEIHRSDGSLAGLVIGAGHLTAADTTNLAASMPEVVSPEATVGLLHSQVLDSLGADRHEPYAPCTTTDLADRDYDYWALGHVHQRQQVLDRPPAWYPGNLQGRHFGECGAKGALLVSVAHGETAKVRFRPLAPVRWERVVPAGLETVTTLGELEKAITTSFAALSDDSHVTPGQEWMLRVVLSGPCPLAPQLGNAEEIDDLADRLTAALGVLSVEVRVERVTRPVDIDTHREQPHLLGTTLALLDELESEDELLDQIAPQHLAGFEGDDPDARRSYLRELLDGLDLEAAEALIREDTG
jgi:hypothetical protein